MSYTVEQLKTLDARELLTIAEHDVCEFSTTATEQALIYQLNDLLHVNDDMLCPHEVEDVLNEVSAQLPDDDFLGHAIDIANDIAKGKMLKDSMKAEGLRLANLLEAIQDEQRSATDYACHEILKLTQPDAAKTT
ncbi:hypothetical protein [uncultured Psychrobacter sp.]|uniref:hypothetical protein n=1 Tax=uncultured Psychrobacter sp. TaxID=259303 RepID=UPI00262B0598|nr:hypothetical protein [uncultured Psychrobacter sp.]